MIGLSILSGSHLALVPDILARLAADGVDAPVVVGGIIPEADQTTLLAAGVAAVYTPKDFEWSRIMRDVAELDAWLAEVRAAAVALLPSGPVQF